MSRLGIKSLTLLAAVAVLAVVRPAHAAPPWRELVRAELARVLTPAEVERLLASRFADAALDELFAGWDGQGDVLSVRRGADGIVLETIIRDRHCTSRLSRPEAPIEAPVCEDVVRADGVRTATFGRDVYAPPKPRSPPRSAPPGATAARCSGGRG